MPTQQPVRSFIRGDILTEFAYADGFEWGNDIGEEEQTYRIPSGDTTSDEEYQGGSKRGPRVFAVRGMVIGTSLSDLQDKLDTLFRAHPEGVGGKLRRRIMDGMTTISDRFIACRVSYLRKGPESGQPFAKWEIGFRAARSVYQNWDLEDAVALVHGGGTTTITPGGNTYCYPIITLVVTHAGTITITPSVVASPDSSENIALTVTATGTYVIDCDARSIRKSGANMIDKVSDGGFFALPDYEHDIALALAGGATLSSATIQWRPNWKFS